MFNVDIKSAIRRAGFRHYEVAAALNISEYTLSKWLSRGEVAAAQKEKIYSALSALADKRAKEAY